jgi:hypothetical protein
MLSKNISVIIMPTAIRIDRICGDNSGLRISILFVWNNYSYGIIIRME